MKSIRTGAMLFSVATITCMLLHFACHHRKTRLIHETNSDMHPLKIISLAGGNYCGIETGMDLLVTSKEDWENLWKKVHEKTYPLPQLPDVDFATETVLAAFLGTRSTGGFSIEITQITEDAGQYSVFIKTRSPDPGEMVSMAISQPFHIIKIDIATSNIIFIRE